MYDYYHYNDPNTGNKNVYAYGSHELTGISGCGFIYADTKAQANVVLKASNRAWQDDCVFLKYSTKECEDELLRRKMAAQSK